MNHPIKIYYIMGVSGCGKSTIGKLLSEKFDMPFYDGDDYHPETNIEKMRSGKALNDEDRLGWLHNLNRLARSRIASGAVIACSALKKSYREILREGLQNESEFIYLEGSYRSIVQRLKKRKGHFMPAELLKSQFEALEPPAGGITVSIEQSPEDIIDTIMKALNSPLPL